MTNHSQAKKDKDKRVMLISSQKHKLWVLTGIPLNILVERSIFDYAKAISDTKNYAGM